MDEPVYRVTLARSGRSFDAPAGVPLLLAAERAGIALPSSCRNGTCRTCLRPLRSGQIAYGIAWPGVSADEKREGLVLLCVALARSDLVLD